MRPQSLAKRIADMTAQPHGWDDSNQAKVGTEKRRPDSNDWRAISSPERGCRMCDRERQHIQCLRAWLEVPNGSVERRRGACRANEGAHRSAATRRLTAAIYCGWIQPLLRRRSTHLRRSSRVLHAIGVNDRRARHDIYQPGLGVRHMHLGTSHCDPGPIEDQGHTNQHT